MRLAASSRLSANSSVGLSLSSTAANIVVASTSLVFWAFEIDMDTHSTNQLF
jgi:hypothetical protein